MEQFEPKEPEKQWELKKPAESKESKEPREPKEPEKTSEPKEPWEPREERLVGVKRIDGVDSKHVLSFVGVLIKNPIMISLSEHNQFARDNCMKPHYLKI